MSWSKVFEGRAPLLPLLFVVLMLSCANSAVNAAEAGDTVYQVKGGPKYNGSTEGYIMSWDKDSAESGQGRYFMRVAFSVDRPAFHVSDTIGAMLRTDGYFSRDSGWWYVVKNGDIKFISIFYPNWTTAGEQASTLVLNLTGQKTDSLGIWRNETLVFTDERFPMGRYKVRAQVTGPPAQSGIEGVMQVSLSGITVGNQNGGSYLTVFFDLVGPLNVSMVPIPSVARGVQISINGTVYQPNGRVFNSSEVLGIPNFPNYWVNLSVLQPNLSIWRSDVQTTTGKYAVTYRPTSVGKHYAVTSVETVVGNEGARGKQTTGRTFYIFVVTGTWPEVSLAIAGEPLRVLLALAAGFILRKRRAEDG